MDKKFLDKVVDQLVRETRIDYENDRIFTPFYLLSFPLSSLSLSPFSPYPSFIIHCRDVYGLNEQEIKYVWKEYRNIIKDKISQNY
jgi:hypothetical protein